MYGIHVKPHVIRANAILRTLKIYGRADQRRVLEPKLVWATPGHRGFPKPTANGVRQIPGAPTQRATAAPVPAPPPSQRAGPSSSQRVQSQATTAAQQEAQRTPAGGRSRSPRPFQPPRRL